MKSKLYATLFSSRTKNSVVLSAEGSPVCSIWMVGLKREWSMEQRVFEVTQLYARAHFTKEKENRS